METTYPKVVSVMKSILQSRNETQKAGPAWGAPDVTILGLRYDAAL